MATVAPPAADQAAAADLLKNLSLEETQSKKLDAPQPTKKTSVNQLDAPNGQIQPSDRSLSPLMLPDYMDPNLCFLPGGYPAFYYGYDNPANEWEDYQRGVDMSNGVYGDNGSLMYPGFGYAPYPPYSPAGSPVPTMGNDGQLYGPQHYQYPPFFQHLSPTNGPYNPTPAAGAANGDINTSVAADQKPLSAENGAKANSNGLANGSVNGTNVSDPLKPTNQKISGSNGTVKGAAAGGFASSGFVDPRYAFDGMQSPLHWFDGSSYSDRQQQKPNGTAVSNGTNGPASKTQNNRPNSNYMGLQHPRPLPAYMNGMFPNKLYGQQYGSTYGSNMVYGSNGFGMRTNGRGWMPVDGKNKPRGRGYYGYNNEYIDGLNELNRGPRAKGGIKNQKGFTPVAVAVKGQTFSLNGIADEEKKEKDGIAEREQYNHPEFPEEYSDAKFFVIKSYSEDDVHKSIKYNVWASTPNGNKKLDAAYKEAHDKNGGCPVFLFFSVNASGQFVGLAEMVGPVDFEKSCEYWQQDKWNGSFPVKWHIVKDVPNSLLKHITLENNENKSVTNSRDTQEVKLEPGVKMIKLFKEHISKTCLLDDFGFYENRQRTIQEKKAKQKQFQKQVWEGKATSEEKDSVNELKAQSPIADSDLSKETIPNAQSNGGHENGAVVNIGDGLMGAKAGAVLEKGIIANGC